MTLEKGRELVFRNWMMLFSGCGAYWTIKLKSTEGRVRIV